MNDEKPEALSSRLDGEAGGAAIGTPTPRDEEVLHDYRRIGEAIRNLPQPEVGDEFTWRVLAAAAGHAAPARRRLRYWALPAGLAAALLLALAFAFQGSEAPTGTDQALLTTTPETHGAGPATLHGERPEAAVQLAQNGPAYLDEAADFLAAPQWDDDLSLGMPEDLFALLDSLEPEEEAAFQNLLLEYGEGRLFL